MADQRYWFNVDTDLIIEQELEDIKSSKIINNNNDLSPVIGKKTLSTDQIRTPLIFRNSLNCSYLENPYFQKTISTNTDLIVNRFNNRTTNYVISNGYYKKYTSTIETIMPINKKPSTTIHKIDKPYKFNKNSGYVPFKNGLPKKSITNIHKINKPIIMNKNLTYTISLLNRNKKIFNSNIDIQISKSRNIFTNYISNEMVINTSIINMGYTLTNILRSYKLTSEQTKRYYTDQKLTSNINSRLYNNQLANQTNSMNTYKDIISSNDFILSKTSKKIILNTQVQNGKIYSNTIVSDQLLNELKFSKIINNNIKCNSFKYRNTITNIKQLISIKGRNISQLSDRNMYNIFLRYDRKYYIEIYKRYGLKPTLAMISNNKDWIIMKELLNNL